MDGGAESKHVSLWEKVFCSGGRERRRKCLMAVMSCMDVVCSFLSSLSFSPFSAWLADCESSLFFLFFLNSELFCIDTHVWNSVHPFFVTSVFEPGPTWSAKRALFRSTQIYGRAQAITPGSADQNSDIALSSAFILPVLLSSQSLSPCCNTDCLCKAAVCKSYKNQ